MKFSHLLTALIVPIFIQSNAVFGQPLVTGVTPNRGSTGGGTLVTITGSDFTDATAVTFGGIAAESFTVVNNGTIQAQTPVGTIGAAQVAVASSSGVSQANSPDDLFVLLEFPNDQRVAITNAQIACRLAGHTIFLFKIVQYWTETRLELTDH